jgi:hypothetical protein
VGFLRELAIKISSFLSIKSVFEGLSGRDMLISLSSISWFRKIC